MSFEFSVLKEISHIWWAGVCNNHPFNFGFTTGFVLKIGDVVTVFWFKDAFLKFALVFKGLHIGRVLSNVEEELLCFALLINFLWRRWRRCD